MEHAVGHTTKETAGEMVSKAIEQAQVKVEGFHLDTRKRLVEFDDVTNQQRDIVYKLRKRILDSNDIKEEVLEKLKHQIEKNIHTNLYLILL